jgi:acyl-CoA reductase-like NAD-dependent aldehyde dehydrogenase
MTEIPVLDPATAREIGVIEDMGEGVVGRTVSVARAAFREGGRWPRTPDDERAEWDVAEAARILGYYAGRPTKAAGESYPVSSSALSIVVHELVGVVAAITPWNYPLLLAVQKDP